MIDDFATQKVKQILKDIEKRENIKIWFASEVGSRAYGFNRPTSDFDVRYFYVNPLSWYLSVEQKSIQDTISDKINTESGLSFDIHGWDLRKAMYLFLKSNANFYEWINSPIQYIRNPDLISKIKNLSSEIYQPHAAAYHYFNLARAEWNNSIWGKDEVEIKSYFNAVRCLLACRVIIGSGLPPPVEISELLKVVGMSNGAAAEFVYLSALNENGYISHDAKTSLNDYIRDSVTEPLQISVERVSDEEHEKQVNKVNRLFASTIIEASIFP